MRPEVDEAIMDEKYEKASELKRELDTLQSRGGALGTPLTQAIIESSLCSTEATRGLQLAHSFDAKMAVEKALGFIKDLQGSNVRPLPKTKVEKTCSPREHERCKNSWTPCGPLQL